MGLFDGMLSTDMHEDTGRRELPPDHYILESILAEEGEKLSPTADKWWKKDLDKDNDPPSGYTLRLPLRIIGGKADHEWAKGRIVFGKVPVREFDKKKISGQFIAILNALISPGVGLDYPPNDPERHRLRWEHTQGVLEQFANECGLSSSDFITEPDFAHALVCTAALYLASNPGRLLARVYKQKSKDPKYPDQDAISDPADINTTNRITKHNLVFYVQEVDNTASPY